MWGCNNSWLWILILIIIISGVAGGCGTNNCVGGNVCGCNNNNCGCNRCC